MPTAGSRRRTTRAALAALANIGGTDWQVIGIVLFFLLVLAMVTDTFVALLTTGDHGLFFVGAGGVLVLSVTLLKRYAQAAARELRPSVSTRISRPVPCLVLFLSPPGRGAPDGKAVQHALGAFTAITGSLADRAVREAMDRHPWRMPAEAINHHLPFLERVVVIGSSDVLKPDGSEPDFGSHHHVTTFIADMRDRLPTFEAGIRFQTLAEVLGDGRYRDGVNFEDLEQTVDALHDLYKALRADGLGEAEILVDITGGQKVNSVAGAAVAILVRERRFQYVSTRDYKVRSYDVTQDLDDLHGA